jgi:hypothetical protein
MYNKRRNRLAQPNVEKAVRAHDNLVLRKAILLSRQLTMQTMMTLILTPALRVKTNTD